MFRSRSWFGGGWGRPKNPHSLEHLKYLYNVLLKNHTVSEYNRGLLVESLRSIAEILIWGDQNDSSVFDFFLEKNMLVFFLRIMRQRSGGSSFVCVQLLQTLNILFENIRNETSLYYLLSNNHVNSIIVHKFDFSDEEVMAYYISFLKTLSLKLNAHTIHFFYNEHTNDFPLYTEAIKFFNHPESMVRIAVRTLTLNVYRVEDASMLAFIRDRTAAPYFSNIVWFIGKHIQELDACVRNDADHQSQNRLSDLVAEHLDHLHYLNDILCLNITDLNQVLTDHLLHKLLIPLYIYSLSPQHRRDTPLVATATTYGGAAAGGGNGGELNAKVSSVVALFLLSQVFLIISHPPLIRTLAWIILKTDKVLVGQGVDKLLEHYEEDAKNTQVPATAGGIGTPVKTVVVADLARDENDEDAAQPDATNVTDEEKMATPVMVVQAEAEKPFLEAVLSALDCNENDYAALFAFSLLYAMANNKGVTPDLIEHILRPKKSVIAANSGAATGGAGATAGGGSKDVKYAYNNVLVDRILHVMMQSCQPQCRVRLVTLELCLKLLGQLVTCDGRNILSESHRASVDAAKAQSTSQVRNFYKSEEIFLDMFEHEYCDMSKGSLNVEWLCMDSAILLPPTGTPLTGIDFTKRLPCGEVERAKRAIRVFFLVRDLVLQLNGDVETQLPLTNPHVCVQIDQALDLSIARCLCTPTHCWAFDANPNSIEKLVKSLAMRLSQHNSDLIACTLSMKDGLKLRRFLVIDILQLILVEPDTKRLGWGVAKLVGFLQDIEVSGDKDDSRCLHITIHGHLTRTAGRATPLLSAKFVFDDNIRCMAAKQRLTKGRIKARQKKMQQIARLLDIPGQTGPPSPAYVGARYAASGSRDSRPLFTAGRVPGFAAPRREHGVVHRTDDRRRRDSDSPSRIAIANSKKENCSRPQSRSREPSGSRKSSREGSPRMPRPRSEEIPLELIKKTPAASAGILDMSPKVTMPRPLRADTPAAAAVASCDYAATTTAAANAAPPPPLISAAVSLPPMAGAKDVDVVSITSEETSFTFPDTHAHSTTTMTTTTRAITSVQEEAPQSSSRRGSAAKGIIETV